MSTLPDTTLRARHNFVALAACAVAAIVLAACAAGPGAPPVTFSVFDLPPVAHPPTPDPPIDPGVLEPQVLLSPAYISAVEITAVGGGRLEITVTGSLPTPCHSLRAGVSRAAAERTLDIAMWSEAPFDQVCGQVLTAFAHVLSVEGLEAGRYVVELSGIEISEVELDGALAT